MSRIIIPKNKIAKELKKTSQCRQDEYVYIKDEIKFYKNIKSNQQIKTILHLKQNKSNFYYYHRLLQLLSSHINFSDYFYLLKYLKKEKDDLSIYKYLQKYIKKKGGNLYTKCTRHEPALSFFTKHLKNKKITNYLDIGCGDCKLTKILGNHIGLSDTNIYGADISSWGAYTEEARKKIGININTLKGDGILPFKDNSFSLISAFMCLHHVKPLEKILSEISRILKPNAYFIIKEHDAMNYLDYMLCDIEHGLYEVTDRNNIDFINTYYGIYYDIIEWNCIMEQYGLKFIDAEYASMSIYYNLTPNRAFFGIYYKV